MKPRPLYRWKSFWLGLFVLVFFGWAWWHSTQYRSQINIGFAERQLTVMRLNGFTVFFTVPAPGSKQKFGFFSVRGNEWNLEGLISAAETFGYRSFKVPDSLVFFSFLGLWSGWLAWRWRRIKNVQTNAVRPDP